MRFLLLILGVLTFGAAQSPTGGFVCPMDPDIRSDKPARCSRCGMKLVPGIPDPVEYPVRISTRPRVIKPGQTVELAFEIEDPKTGKRTSRLEIVHEKLFHLFLISEDLRYFTHEHPEPGKDGIFRFPTVFPRPGLYRVLCDFYPSGGTPQVAARTLITAGYEPPEVLEPAKLTADLSPKTSENLTVELTTEPAEPIAGWKTLLFFRLTPSEGLEPYLGAWGHLLAASGDLVDVIHSHPFIADGGPLVQFNVIFPREAVYRVWVQFQRKGKVNTVAFNIPVKKLR